MNETPAAAAVGREPSKRWVTGRRARVLLCTSGVSFMIMLDSNIVAVSLPAIARDLNAAFSDIEWVVSAYVLTFAALLMPAGALADRYGRRLLLLIGLSTFTIASLLCGFAPNTLVLNLSRALQGVGAALQLSAALASLGHEFRGADRARAFGFWGTVLGTAVAIGPVVGGVITSAFGWRWAFLVNGPVGIGLITLAVLNVEESDDPHAVRLDFGGIVTFGLGLFTLVWALIDGNADGWASTATLVKLGISVTFFALFVVLERAQKRPMVDLALFRSGTFLGASVAMLGFASAAQVMMTYLPLYLQNGFDYTPAAAGLGMLPFALPLFFCPRVAVALSARLSGRVVLTAGLVIVALGNFVTAATIVAQGSYGLVAIGMLFTGCGAGLLNGETAKVSMSVVPPERGGMASGIAGTLRFVGLVMGITGLGAVLAMETTRQFAQRAATVGLTLPESGVRTAVSRIVAGDVGGAVETLHPAVPRLMLDVARESFASGFTIILIFAGILATLAAGLVFVLVKSSETQANSATTTHSRLAATNTPPLPDMLD